MSVRHLYTALLYLITPLILLRLLWRGLSMPEYRQRWRERFGHVPRPDDRQATGLQNLRLPTAEEKSR